MAQNPRRLGPRQGRSRWMGEAGLLTRSPDGQIESHIDYPNSRGSTRVFLMHPDMKTISDQPFVLARNVLTISSQTIAHVHGILR